MIDARRAESIDQLRKFALGGLDRVLALAGGDGLERCLDFVRPGGRVVYPNGIEPVPSKRRTFRVQAFDMRRESAAIRAAESAPHGGPDSCADHSTLFARESRPGASAIGSATRAGADGPADTSLIGSALVSFGVRVGRRQRATRGQISNYGPRRFATPR